MRIGSNLQVLAQSIQSAKAQARDYVVDTRSMTMEADNHILLGQEIGSPVVLPTRHMHNQLATRLRVPTRFYDELGDKHPDLRANLVTELLHREPQRRMVRTLGDKGRAYLSDRYRRFDNWQVAEATLPVLAEQPDMQILSAELTEQRMYIKALFPRIMGEVKRGDAVQAGVAISNSEIGGGRTKVELLIYRLVCTNGMLTSIGEKRNHVGRAAGAGDEEGEVYELYSDATLAADDRAFTLKLQDSVRSFATDARFFQQALVRFQEAAGEIAAAKPIEAVTRLAQRASLTEGEKDSVLQHLLGGGDLSRWGYANAITRAAEDAASYDRATDLERMGWDLIDDSSMWSVVAK